MIYIDAFTKMAHFMSTRKTLDAAGAAELTQKHVICAHGVPKVIVSDRDKRWINSFWKHLHPVGY